MQSGGRSRRSLSELPFFSDVNSPGTDNRVIWLTVTPEVSVVESGVLLDDSETDTDSVPDLVDDMYFGRNPLTVDCTGSDTGSMPALEDAGYPSPPMAVVDYSGQEAYDVPPLEYPSSDTDSMPGLEDVSNDIDRLRILRYPDYDSDDSDLPPHNCVSTNPGGWHVFDNHDLLASMFIDYPIFGDEGPSTMPDIISDEHLNSMDLLSLSLSEGPDLWAGDALSDVVGLLEPGEFGTIERQASGSLHMHLYLYLSRQLDDE